tara:strand:- start:521 stop:706 length:186 start_codon:yes stop_codon:yes gene_type:complete
MDRITELKEIIKTQTPIAELGHVQAQQEVINAQIELDDLLALNEFPDQEDIDYGYHSQFDM